MPKEDTSRFSTPIAIETDPEKVEQIKLSLELLKNLNLSKTEDDNDKTQ